MPAYDGRTVDIDLLSREEAYDYIRNRCNNCCIRNWCNDYDSAKCNGNVDKTVKKFRSKNNVVDARI